MNRFTRMYNKNRQVIWIMVLIVVGIIALIQILNNFASEKKANNQGNNNLITSDKNYSVITGQQIEKDVYTIIDEFVDYCNNQQIENAYVLLSKECKELLYPTVNEFYENYYSRIFTSKKTHIYQAWIADGNYYTYKVDFVDDILATGSASTKSITDYYTIVTEDGIYKLNLNKLVKSNYINSQTTQDGITISILKKNVYIDYEKYEIKIKNEMEESIVIGDLQNTKSIYVEGYEGKICYWNNYELFENDVLVEEGSANEITIRFDKAYNPNYETNNIVFSDIIINNERTVQIDVAV